MKRTNNIYGDLINNKFSELLSADSEASWIQMKKILDNQMPGKGKNKWLFWFINRTGLVISLLIVLVAAAATYKAFYQKEVSGEDVPAVQNERKDNIEKAALENQSKILPEKIVVSVSESVTDQKIVLQSSETRKGKANKPATRKNNNVKNENTLLVTHGHIVVDVKDSVNTHTPSTAIEVAKRAF